MLRRISLGLASAVLCLAAATGAKAAEPIGPICVRTTDADTGHIDEYRFNLISLTTNADVAEVPPYLVYTAGGIRLAGQTAAFVPVSGALFVRFVNPVLVRIQFTEGLDITGVDAATTLDFFDLGLGTGVFITERNDEFFSGSATQVQCIPLPAS
jgi:hypothetical protein